MFLATIYEQLLHQYFLSIKLQSQTVGIEKLRETLLYVKSKAQGGNSQNFLRKFVRFFVTLGLKILRLNRLKVLF